MKINSPTNSSTSRKLSRGAEDGGTTPAMTQRGLKNPITICERRAESKRNSAPISGTEETGEPGNMAAEASRRAAGLLQDEGPIWMEM